MRLYQRIVITLFLLSPASAGTTWAQTSALSLDACVEYALQHSSKLRIARATTDEATADYREAIGRLLPNLNANASAHISFGRGIDPKTNAYTNTNAFSNSYGLESSLLIFDGGASIYRLLSAREARQIGQEEQLRTARAVRMATIEAFYNLLYCRELERLACANLSNSERLAQQIARMHELGMKAKTDVAEARATQARDRQTLIERGKQRAVALLQLKEAMDFPLDAPLSVIDSLAYGEASPTLLAADEVLSGALDFLPEARIAAHQLRRSRYEYQESRGAFFPSIHLIAGLGSGFSYFIDSRQHEPFWQQLSNRRGAYIGATVSFSLFTGLQRCARQQHAKARYLAQQTRRALEQRKIYTEVQEAILEVNSSAEAYRAAVEAAEYSQQNYETALRNYLQGHASSLELSTHTTRYKEAQAEVAHSYAMYLLHSARLNQYTGYDKNH